MKEAAEQCPLCVAVFLTPWVIMAWFGGIAIIGYIIMWFIVKLGLAHKVWPESMKWYEGESWFGNY
jgi:hypothetical protein